MTSSLCFSRGRGSGDDAGTLTPSEQVTSLTCLPESDGGVTTQGGGQSDWVWGVFSHNYQTTTLVCVCVCVFSHLYVKLHQLRGKIKF